MLYSLKPIFKRFGSIFLMMLFIWLTTSCCPELPYCKNIKEYKSDTLYNIELKNPVKATCRNDSSLSFTSYFIPIYYYKPDFDTVDYKNCTIQIDTLLGFYDANCQNCNNIVNTDLSNLKRITNLSTTNDPAILIQPIAGCYEDCDCYCTRTRTVDEYTWEIKGLAGFRDLGNGESINYPESDGNKIYEHQFFSTDINSSTLIAGGEIALSRNFEFLDNWFSWLDSQKGAVKIGLMTGIWPMDGSVFIPVGLHLRYDINLFFNPCPYWNWVKCNSWYYFANAGVALSTNSNTKFTGFFGDIGVGYDMALGKSLDFTIDFGFRFVHNPLPQINAPQECLDNVDVNPTRSSGLFLLRFGLTF